MYDARKMSGFLQKVWFPPKLFSPASTMFPEGYMVPSRIADWAARFMLPQMPKSTRILDFGCGNGRDVDFYKRLGFRKVRGYDPFSQKYKCLPSSDFDLIFLVSVLNTIDDPQDRRDVLELVRQRLDDEGVLVLLVRSEEGIQDEVVQARDVGLDCWTFGDGVCVKDDEGIVRFQHGFTKKEVVSLARSCGFSPISDGQEMMGAYLFLLEKRSSA